MGGGRTGDCGGGARALAELAAINAFNVRARAIVQFLKREPSSRESCEVPLAFTKCFKDGWRQLVGQCQRPDRRGKNRSDLVRLFRRGLRWYFDFHQSTYQSRFQPDRRLSISYRDNKSSNLFIHEIIKGQVPF